MKALILGAAGQLGSELVRLLGDGTGVTHQQASISDQSGLTALFAARRPDVVFNCAAYNAVDRAESEPEAAHEVNSQGPFNVAAACVETGSRLVHFSTNFVFDGALDRPYVESDPPSPLGAYARSKLEGEHRVLEAMPSALVIRTSGVFGGHRGQSFPEKILQRARGGQPLRVVGDQRVNPTFTGDLAPAAMRLAADGLKGIVHLVASGCCGWDQYAAAVLAEFELPASVESVSTADYAAPARRPLNGCLASERVAQLRSWREGLHDWAVRSRTRHP